MGGGGGGGDLEFGFFLRGVWQVLKILKVRVKIEKRKIKTQDWRRRDDNTNFDIEFLRGIALYTIIGVNSCQKTGF